MPPDSDQTAPSSVALTPPGPEQERQIANAMLRDQPRLRRWYRELHRHKLAAQRRPSLQQKFDRQLAASVALRELRRQHSPQVTLAAELPVSDRAEDIAALIRANQVIILAGETGSGKTTQLPKICLQLGYGQGGMIAHTQPRRIAARSVAARIAEELGVRLGAEVGYQVRFEDSSNDQTCIKLMTDGILLSEIRQDRLLQKYEVLIIDEAHERSLNIDFLLGYIKQILPRRPDLKVIVTSATIDLERFSRHFDGAPVIEVSGRTYPVELRYRPPLPEEADLNTSILAVIRELMAEEQQAGGISLQRDMLVFLPGERDIRELALALRKEQFAHLDVLPLYARLSVAEQRRVFDSAGRRGRRVVLATNVAETSLTVPGIHYVIDPGYARISRYSYRTKVQRLPIEPISQASANQRKGRCGRVADGICIRLYSEDDFRQRAEFTDPELLRTNLASVILQMLSMGLGNIEDFPFVQAPERGMINDGFRLLEELGATDRSRQLTDSGRQLADLPVDPRIARMLLSAAGMGSLREVLIIASVLSIQDPRERPLEKQAQADQQHARFRDRESDFISLLKLWDYYEEQRQSLSQNQLRKLCSREFLSWLRMREWRDTHYQLRLTIRRMGLKENQQPADYRDIHRALASGLLSHIGYLEEDQVFLGARNRRFRLAPGSSLGRKLPKWILVAELLETQQLYGRMAARIEPEWLEGIADHLFKCSWYEPHWNSRRGQVLASEKKTLFGLVISDGRRVNYASIDPVRAREIFIQAALVEGQLKTKAAFLAHNQQLVEELETLEAKARRRNLLADDSLLYQFYDERVATHVVNAAGFEKWRKKAEQKDPQLLFFRRADLLVGDSSEVTEALYPSILRWDDMDFALQYHFEPGHPDDGVSCIIPLGLLNRVTEYRFEWLVPGMLRDKCIALVKGLPKSLRKQFVPVPHYVDLALPLLQPDNKPLVNALGEALQTVVASRLGLEEGWRCELDPFYLMNFKVLDQHGVQLGAGRDLAALVRQFRDQVQQSFNLDEQHPLEQSGLEAFPRDALPGEWVVQQAGIEVRVFPALVDEGETVGVSLFDYAFEAEHSHRWGLVRLLMLSLKSQLKYLRRELLKDNRLRLQLSAVASHDAWIDAALRAIFAEVFLANSALPRTNDEFQAILQKGRAGLVDFAMRFEALLSDIIDLRYQTDQRMQQNTVVMDPDSLEDIQSQLNDLFAADFICEVPFEWLREYPRYLQALLQRIDRYAGQRQKDLEKTRQLSALRRCLAAKLSDDPNALLKDAELLKFRWMLEELRVSLFAQNLGTRFSVSVKRLEKQWQLVH